MAEALYRKYRPQVFEDVVGQEPIERTLKNAISQDKVSHAYLFTGPRGTGKTTTARLLAKALLCQAGPTPDPDGSCDDCLLIADGMHPDVYELDAASRTGVENVREEIISRVSFAPTRGRFKVYIIDEVHMLSTAAFNALLKTLEEPPAHVVFVLCTTDPQKVPETIHSRCQRFDFRRIAPEAMVSRLGAICIAEDVEFEGEALDLIAHRAEGGLRNALTSLEQIIAFENGKVTLAGAERLLGSIDSNDMAEIIAFVGKRDIANCFRWTAEYVETGADLAQFVRDMAEHVRNLYVMALVGEDVELDVGETSRHELVGELQWFGPDRLSRLLGVLGDLSAELKTSSNPRLAFEIALTRMVRPDSDLTIESLAERIEALESGYSAVAHVLPGEPVEHDVVRRAIVDTLQEPEPRRSFPSQAGSLSDAASVAIGASSASGGMRETSLPNGIGARGASGMSSAPSVSGIPGVQGASDTSGVQGASGDSSLEEPGKSAALANPAALSRIWQAALSALKKQKQSYGVLFMNTKARYDAERGMVKVVFPEESTFVFNTVQKPDVQDALAAALEKAAGEPVPFMLEKVGEDPVPARSVESAQAKSMPRPVAQNRQQPESSYRAEHQFQAGQQPQPQSTQHVQPQPSQHVQHVQSQPKPSQHAQPQPQPRSSQHAQRQPLSAARDEMPPYEAVPYEEVPYEEIPYEEVPYEEFDASAIRPVHSAESESSRHRASMHDASTAASPAEANLMPDGNMVEDPASVEALLQAGFGGGVVFSEIDDDVI